MDREAWRQLGHRIGESGHSLRADTAERDGVLGASAHAGGYLRAPSRASMAERLSGLI
jgi:hypothetical protein